MIFSAMPDSIIPINILAIISNFPCPYGCFLSPGFSDIRIPISPRMFENESASECTPSANTLRLPAMQPSASFAAATAMLAAIISHKVLFTAL